MIQRGEIVLRDLLESNGGDPNYQTTLGSENQTEDFNSLVSQDQDRDFFNATYRDVFSKYYWNNMYYYLFFRKSSKYDSFGNSYPKEFKRNAKIIKISFITIFSVCLMVVVFFFLSLLITETNKKIVTELTSVPVWTSTPTLIPRIDVLIPVPISPPKKVIVKVPYKL